MSKQQLETELETLQSELKGDLGFEEALILNDRILEIKRELGIQAEACDVDDSECLSCGS